MPVLLFLFLCTEHEIKTVVPIVVDRDVFVVGVHNEITASRFVVLVNKPALDAVHQLRSNVLARKLAVYAETTDQDRWVDQVAFLLGHIFADALPSGVGKMVGEDTRVGYSKGTDDFVRVVDLEKGVSLSHQLFRVIKIIRGEEFVEVFISAAERRASGNNLRGEWYAGAPVVQKGHLPDSLSSLIRLALAASKLRHISRSAEKSMRPRLRAFSSAVRIKRTAASPDRTGMLLIARAMSNLPSAAYYSKNRWSCAILSP